MSFYSEEIKRLQQRLRNEKDAFERAHLLQELEQLEKLDNISSSEVVSLQESVRSLSTDLDTLVEKVSILESDRDGSSEVNA